MHIKQITIQGLFGKFDHRIPLNRKSRITIIHGPNGVGKTTVLALLEAIFRRDFMAVNKMPFESVKIAFTNGTTLTLARQDSIEPSSRRRLVGSVSTSGNKEPQEHEIPITQFNEKELAQHIGVPLHAIEDMLPPLQQLGPSEWYDASTGDAISLAEVVLRYGDRLPVDFQNLISLPEEMDSLLSSANVYFIQTQRLLTEEPIRDDFHYQYRRIARERRRPRAVVEQWAKEMALRIQEKLRESGALSASLDRQFPSTLLSASLPTSANEDKIRELYKEQTKLRDRLMKAGLIAEENLVDLPPGEIQRSEQKVLWFYLNDVRKKLQVFYEILRKIELFREIINSRFLAKSLAVDKDRGFIITGESNEPIPLTALSSGEQHELVLAYELLFKVKESSLILIDEPELSLHVTWQHKFLDDIGRISELVDLDFLIATHSPSIIHDRTELMIPLE